MSSHDGHFERTPRQKQVGQSRDTEVVIAVPDKGEGGKDVRRNAPIGFSVAQIHTKALVDARAVSVRVHLVRDAGIADSSNAMRPAKAKVSRGQLTLAPASNITCVVCADGSGIVHKVRQKAPKGANTGRMRGMNAGITPRVLQISASPEIKPR